jgi:hypothetical protein
MQQQQTEGLGLVVKELKFLLKKNSNMNIKYSKTLRDLRFSRKCG